MKQLLNNHKTLIVIIVTVLVILIGIYLWGKKAGKKYQPKEVDLPGDINVGGKVFNPGTYTDKIWDEVDAIFLFKNADNLSSVASLSDSQLVAVYNDYNSRYYSKRNQDMIDALADETAVPLPWSYQRDAIINRLKKYIN